MSQSAAPSEGSAGRAAAAAGAIAHSRVATNGITLHVAQAGPANGPLVLLLHGFPEYWAAWAKTIPALVDAGYRVWVPDQRGYNLSDKPQGVPAYTLDTLSGDVAGLIQSAGVTEAAVVGHDWGASVAWWLASRAPERITSLVAVNAPHPVLWQRKMRASWRQRMKSSYLSFFQLPGVPEALLGMRNGSGLIRTLKSSARPGLFSQSDLDGYRKAWSQPGAMTSMLNWYRALKLMPELPALHIEPRTLIIWGADDAFAERSVADESAAICADGRVELVEGATHWVHHEEPERVNGLLREFLTSRS